VHHEDFEHLCKLDTDLDLPVRYFELVIEQVTPVELCHAHRHLVPTELRQSEWMAIRALHLRQVRSLGLQSGGGWHRLPSSARARSDECHHFDPQMLSPLGRSGSLTSIVTASKLFLCKHFEITSKALFDR
jgi:hypothetical protein